MRIGVISDTHGLLRPEALAALRGCERIIHAGDIGKPEVLEGLRALAPLDVIRGNVDSGDWAAHCQQVVSSLGLPCEVIAVQVETGKGIEAGARQARYQALFADAHRDGATVITAHHRDDQAETLLLRLLRGAGVQGLAAMRALDHRQEIAVWRPLLDQSRSVLERHAHEQGLQWQDDPSNQDQSLRRNYLRHSILPALRQRWRGADEILARTAQHMGDARELLDERAQQDADACGVSSQRFPLPGLAALGPPRQRNLLRWWLHRRGASAHSSTNSQFC